MGTFLEGEVTAASAIQKMTAMNLTDHDRQGFTMVARLLLESPNKASLQAVIEKAKASGDQVELPVVVEVGRPKRE